MAKVASFPSLDIIAGFKGKIDFYSWKGIKVVRKWPVVTGHHTTRLESANQRRFTYFQKSLKSLDPLLKNLWRSTAGLANWRYHEIAYRWYMGKGLASLHPDFPGMYPVIKPWPPRKNRLWFIHAAYIVFKEPHAWLLYWTDRPTTDMTLIYSETPPRSNEVIRVERGVTKSCGEEPTTWVRPFYVGMSTSFWGEDPPVTHFNLLPNLFEPAVGQVYFQLVGRRGRDFGFPIYPTTKFDYSTGPVCYFDGLTVPPHVRNGDWWARGIDTFNPAGRTHEQHEWFPYTHQFRSWRWPRVQLPPGSQFSVGAPFPLEFFPPPGRLPA